MPGLAQVNRRAHMAAMFNDTSSPLALLRTRRSGKPRDLVAPAPDDAQMREILSIATRTPDHGKLFPWRFVIVQPEQRATLAALLESAYRAEKPDAGRQEIATMHEFATQAPALVVVLSSPKIGSHIPLWEQELSTGAAAMNLLHAVHASGFAGGWLTAWPAYSDAVRDAFGAPHEKIAGFVFIGTPRKELEERPRPDYDAVVSTWNPRAT